MSIAKSQMKMAVVSDIGNRFDDMLEAANGQRQQSIGARAAAAQIAKNTRTLLATIEQDFEKGELEKVMGEGELAVRRLIKTYVSRTISACDVTTEHYANIGQIAAGKIEAFEQAVKLLKKEHDVEQSKVSSVLAAVDSGAAAVVGDDIMVATPGASVAGAHPGRTLKQQRLAEAAVAVEPNSAGQNGRTPQVKKKKKAAKKTTG